MHSLSYSCDWVGKQASYPIQLLPSNRALPLNLRTWAVALSKKKKKKGKKEKQTLIERPTCPRILPANPSRTPNKLNPKRTIYQDTLQLNVKTIAKFLKVAKWHVTYKGTLMRLEENFLIEASQTRRKWDDIFKILKERKK